MGQSSAKIRTWGPKPTAHHVLRWFYFPLRPHKGALRRKSPSGNLPIVRRRPSPGAVLHAPGRPSTTIPRPEGPENDLFLWQSSKIPRFFQTAPGQSFTPWGVLLSHISPEFPITQSTQQIQKNSSPCRMAWGCSHHKTIPSLCKSITQICARVGSGPCPGASFGYFSGETEK